MWMASAKFCHELLAEPPQVLPERRILRKGARLCNRSNRHEVGGPARISLLGLSKEAECEAGTHLRSKVSTSGLVAAQSCVLAPSMGLMARKELKKCVMR